MKCQTISLFLAAKGAIYHVAIATVIFSRMLRYRVFARKFAWYFIGVYIIKKVIKGPPEGFKKTAGISIRTFHSEKSYREEKMMLYLCDC